MEILSALWLDEKIEELNYWLKHNHKSHHKYRQKKHDRNYWVGKRIELAETNNN
jgi:hypothetical protein